MSEDIGVRLLSKIKDIYRSKHDPNGWIIGKAVLHHLEDNFIQSGFFYIKEGSKDLTLLGLPYFVDNEHPERIELIS